MGRYVELGWVGEGMGRWSWAGKGRGRWSWAG